MTEYPTATSGLLTSLNTGSIDGGLGERVLIDYKEAIMDYKVTQLPVMAFFADPMTTDTGGNIDITLARPSMKLEQINEGTTPEYQHTKLRSERISVKEWGIAVGVTRRMIEDSRFNEVEMALNEARRAVDRHVTDSVVKVIFGSATADAVLGTVPIIATTTEATITTFASNPYSGFFGAGMVAADIDSGSSRLNSYGNESAARLIRNSYVNAAGATAGDLALSDITTAIDRISTHGYNAGHLFISPAHYKSLLDLGDFVTAFTAAQGEAGGAANSTTAAMMPGSPVSQTASTGVVGSLYGLTVIVNAYVPSDRFGIFDLSVKPMVYVERRPLTVEQANPGFGIVGSYMSMRYGLKVIRPEVGCIIINA
tara:strand:+ start:3538 stop:4644 length:1107 start_codon:yes stop_codon:yes gene_type:complete